MFMVLVWAFIAETAAASPRILVRYGGDSDHTPHLEACEHWQRIGDRYIFTNICDTPLAIMLMVRTSRRTVTFILPPGGKIEPTIPAPEMATGAFWTACPLGYEPNVPVTPEYDRIITAASYHCVLARRPGT